MSTAPHRSPRDRIAFRSRRRGVEQDNVVGKILGDQQLLVTRHAEDAIAAGYGTLSPLSVPAAGGSFALRSGAAGR